MSRPSWFERSLIALLVLGCALALTAGDPADAQKSSGKSAKKSTRAAKTPAIDDSNRVLVMVGKDPITRGDVQRRIDQLPDQYRANYSTPDGRKQILDRYRDHSRRFEAAAARRSSRRHGSVIPFTPPTTRELGQDPTAREIEVLQLVADGLVNREIGERLYLSEETVKSHVRHLLAKLQARSRAHAVAVGFRRGLIA